MRSVGGQVAVCLHHVHAEDVRVDGGHDALGELEHELSLVHVVPRHVPAHLLQHLRLVLLHRVLPFVKLLLPAGLLGLFLHLLRFHLSPILNGIQVIILQNKLLKDNLILRKYFLEVIIGYCTIYK